MESEKRGALGLVRLVAGCIILLGLLDSGIYFTQYLMPLAGFQHRDPNQHLGPLDIPRIILDSLPVIAGIVIFIKAKPIAEWLSDWID
ncbi:MAG TPA: hypothetical protein VH280_11300 [Verrucomicrobiae bacterium]|jgi:hypothetical protein|nr:hypothetical protein [Verrucomicrobiae bacterium]